MHGGIALRHCIEALQGHGWVRPVLCKIRPSQALELFCTLIVCLSVVLSGVHVGTVFPPNPTQMDDYSVGARDPLHKRNASLAKHIVDDAPAGCVRSALSTALLEQWAWGEIATPQVQRTAQATMTDGCQHPDLLSLARLGSNCLFPWQLPSSFTEAFDTCQTKCQIVLKWHCHC